MKVFSYVLIVFLLINNALIAQNCKVQLKTIAQTYYGNCKKGKAHGKGNAQGEDHYKGEFLKGYPHGQGVYTWQNGDVFTGNFVRGKKEGKGVFISKAKNKTIQGFWEKDNYVGIYEKAYEKGDYSTNISSYSLKINTKQTVNSIRVYIRKNQKSLRNFNINFIVENGSYQNIIRTPDYIELTKVNFPIRLRANYESDFIEFEIFNAGFWNVRMEIVTADGIKKQDERDSFRSIYQQTDN